MIVSANGLGVGFGDRTVLDEVCVHLDAGDQCALVGRSGSGKTTLLLVLAGLLAPRSGKVERSVSASQVVYVPQAPSLIPELTAAQNAALGLRLRGVDPHTADERGREQLSLLGLDDEAAGALPSELSGGMQQRVALARALAIAPALLLADEPTGALDQVNGARVMDVLQAQARLTGATLVVATHDQQVARRFDRQLTLDPNGLR